MSWQEVLNETSPFGETPFAPDEFGLCRDIDGLSVNSSCFNTNAFSGCDESKSFEYCDCVVVRAADAIERILRWQHGQAVAQLVLSATSLGLGALFMLAFLVWPKDMCRYPQSLAFWMYACDFCKTL